MSANFLFKVSSKIENEVSRSSSPQSSLIFNVYYHCDQACPENYWWPSEAFRRPPRVSNSPSDHWYSSNWNDYSRNGLFSAGHAAKWSFLMIGWIIMKLTNSSFFQVLKSMMATICTNTRNPSEKNPVCAIGGEVCDTNANTITNKDENMIAIQEIQERKSLCVLWEPKSVMASSKYKYKHR